MKKALKVEAQIEKLKKRGMQFGDEERAKEILLDVGYYRLGFYSFPFERTYPRLEHRDHKFKEGTMFEDVLELYYFDNDLRHLLVYFLNMIEVNIRTQITYVVSNHYRECPIWFVNPNVVLRKYINFFNSEVYPEIKKEPIIKRHHENHINDTYAPAWKTLEFMTLGNILKLYLSVKDGTLQTEIAGRYNCSFRVFCNYVETIRILRNRCAHGCYLYNVKLPVAVRIQPANVEQSNRSNIVGAIKVVKYVVEQISTDRAHELITRLNELLNRERSQKTVQVMEECTKLSQLFEYNNTKNLQNRKI